MPRSEGARSGKHSAASNYNRMARYRGNRENAAKVLLTTARNNARKKDQEFTIGLELVEELLAPWRCSMTGWYLRWDHSRKRDPLRPSLDRIDNLLGYVPGNVRIVCWMVNWARSGYSDGEFLTMCRAVVAGAPPF